MSSVVNVLQYAFPVLVVSIAVVLLCFYVHAKKKRAAYDVTPLATQGEDASSRDSSGAEVPDRLPPRYSTVDQPPPYSLFDPKLTSVWPGGPPPAYEMYPIMLPLAPHHHWVTPTGPEHPHQPPQRSQQSAPSS